MEHRSRNDGGESVSRCGHSTCRGVRRQLATPCLIAALEDGVVYAGNQAGMIPNNDLPETATLRISHRSLS